MNNWLKLLLIMLLGLLIGAGWSVIGLLLSPSAGADDFGALAVGFGWIDLIYQWSAVHTTQGKAGALAFFIGCVIGSTPMILTVIATYNVFSEGLPADRDTM